MTPSQLALIAALQSEYAAIYIYGVIDAYAAPGRAVDVARTVAEHRARRETILDALAAGGVDPPVASPAYSTPVPITDPVSALHAAVIVEEDGAAAYHALLSAADSADLRGLAADGLSGAAMRAARWRIALAISPTTPAFPGADG